jgi:protein-tyrosine-phosphatase
MKKILIVGSHNTCRSIIAAEYLKKAIKDRGKAGVEVSTAGIMAFPDIPADHIAIAGLKNLGIAGEFKSRPLGRQEVMDAALIITLSQRIKAAILGKFAEKAGIIYTLKEIAGEPETDITVSEKIVQEIKVMIDKGFNKIAGD